VVRSEPANGHADEAVGSLNANRCVSNWSRADAGFGKRVNGQAYIEQGGLDEDSEALAKVYS
jgi:hypothetical protein